jgi:prevent-host-death family protein
MTMVGRPWYGLCVEKMAISKFKAECLAVLERVRRTGDPVLVTRFGKPVAEIVPASKPPTASGWLGGLAATGRVVGDIVASESRDWEVLERP